MAKKSVEHLKHESSKGFDKPGQLSTAAKIAIAVAIILAIIIAVQYLGKVGMGQHSGGVRNCIKSVLGNDPDCSDNDGTPKSTYVNGKYIGICSKVSVDGTCIK